MADHFCTGDNPWTGVYHVGIMKCTQSAPVKPGLYINDGRVKFKNLKNCFVGENGLPVFDLSNPMRRKRNQYKTIFGPYGVGNFQFPHCGNEGLILALRRLTKVREPERYGYDAMLTANQRTVFDWLADLYVDFTSKLSVLIKRSFDHSLDHLQLRERWAYDTSNPKWRMRVDDFLLQVDEGDVSGTTGIRGYVDVKPKETEANAKGKPGNEKVGRVIGDLGVRASSKFGPYADYVKAAMIEEFSTRRGSFQFVSDTTPGEMRRVFTRLNDHCTGFLFFYHSDDVVASVKCRDGILRMNCDISACDGSHRHIIKVFEEFLSGIDARWYDDVKQTFEQLRTNFRVRSEDGSQSAVGSCADPQLYSGSTLTTIMNCFAVCVAILCFEVYYDPGMTMSETSDQVIKSFERAGYLITTQICEEFSDFQFLKYSGVILDEGVAVYRNIGAWLKSFGTCDGDLPGRSSVPIRERANRRNAEVTMSHKHDGHHVLSHALFKKYFGDVSELTGAYIPTVELAKRYRCTVTDLEELAYFYSIADVGDVISHHVLSAIYEIDYGTKRVRSPQS